VRRAVRTMENIVEAGVNLVDLEDAGRIYNTDTLDDGGMAFLIMAIRFMRANQESVLKGERVRHAYDNKRKIAASGEKATKPFTRKLPAWIFWNEDAREHQVHADRADMIRSIFEKAVSGWGQHRIAQWLNEQVLPTWGDAARWHRSYVRKILVNPAVIGTFTPHHKVKDGTTGKRKRKPLASIEHYFPAVVTKETFDHIALGLATAAARGRHPNREPQSIFSGVLKCARCGGTVSRVSNGDHVYLVCASANSRAGCRYQAVPYGDMEDLFRTRAEHIIENAPRGKDTVTLEKNIADLRAAVDGLEDAARDLVEELRTNSGEAVRRRLREIEADLEQAEGKLKAFVEQRETLTNTNVQRRLHRLHEALTQEPLNVVEANLALKHAVREIIMNLDRGTLELHWHHEDPEKGALHEVTFVTKHFPWGATA
jgi:Recombinase/Recombinase zinc beta ribbon domain